MSLIRCPECKGQISDTAESCPHCGYIISKSKELKHRSLQDFHTVLNF